MRIRTLGRTGIQVGEIGLGCEGLQRQTQSEVVHWLDTMQDHGANALDLYSPNPVFRNNLGKALQGRREHFILEGHLCTYWHYNQYVRTRNFDLVKASFEDLYTRLKTDVIDIGMIHYVDSVEEWERIANSEILSYAMNLKANGAIRSIGISSHNAEAAYHAVKSGVIDVVLFSINPCYDLLPPNEDCMTLWESSTYAKYFLNIDPTRQKFYDICNEKGIALTVMKAFGGGDLLYSDVSPAKVSLSPYQCIHYALDRPGVSCIMAGCRSHSELMECLSYEDAPLEETDYAVAFMKMPKMSWKGHCMYCGHCAPCPKGIPIADVTKFLNLAEAHGEIPETVREHYSVLEHFPSECVHCGNCEKRCPFDVQIIDNMKRAVKLFGR